MNFVLTLAKTTRKNYSLFVVTDRFSKMTHFLPCSRSTYASHMAKLFFKEIVRLHGLSTTIVFNRDVKFGSYFLKTLWNLFGTTLKHFYVFHPQIDGQIKIVNDSLGDFLRCLVGDKFGNWDLILPHAEFTYNNSVNRSTDKSPFEIVHSLSPYQPIDFLPLPTDIVCLIMPKLLLNISIICMSRLDEKLF